LSKWSKFEHHTS